MEEEKEKKAPFLKKFYDLEKRVSYLERKLDVIISSLRR